MSDDEYPLWPPEVIDRLRVCNVEPHYRRRWRDRVRVFGESLGGMPPLLRVSLTLQMAKTDGRRPAGDLDELILDVNVADAWVIGCGVLVSRRTGAWLNERGVTRW